MDFPQHDNARKVFMEMGTIESNPNKKGTVEYNYWECYFNSFMIWFLTSIPVNTHPI